MDLPAGVMVAILLVPQAIAYAYLAGMPPQYGLYTALVPCVLYAIFGTSPHLAIGPVAVSALLVMAGVSVLAEPFSESYIALVILSGLLIGILQLILGILRLGSLVNLLSYPVITGFTSAASIIVIVNQLKDVFRLTIPRSDFLFDTLIHIGQNLGLIHLPTLLIGIITFITIYTFKKINKKIPSGLIVVVVGIALSYFLNFEKHGIDIIAHVPSGLPSFALPDINIESVILLIPTVLLVTLIGIIESVGIAKAIESKHDYYNIDTNQELRALGISKIGGSFFQSIPSSGSFSRSALLNESRGRSTIASIISVIFVVIALIFLTPLLYFLPKVILAVIIIFAVKNLFEYALAKSFYKTNRLDLAVMLITFVFTLLINIESGIFLGFIASLIVVLYCAKHRLQSLIRILLMKESDNIDLELKDQNLNIQITDQLNFGNAPYLKKVAAKKIDESSNLSKLIFDFEKTVDIDSTGLKTISHLISYAKTKGIDTEFVNNRNKVENRLNRSGLLFN